MKEYVVGYIFDMNNKVALIQKERPDWQKGRLNGIGGKIEPGEKPIEAMIREFKEETGVSYEHWDNMITLEDKEGTYRLHVFHSYTFNLYDLNLKTTTDEEVAIYSINKLNDSHILPSALWMIHMCRDDGARGVYINY